LGEPYSAFRQHRELGMSGTQQSRGDQHELHLRRYGVARCRVIVRVVVIVGMRED
jgi:hypothetical protein